MSTTSPRAVIDGDLLMDACRRADITDALFGDITIDGRGCLCVMFPTGADHDAFFDALHELDADAATALERGSFAGQAHGKLTVLKPEFASLGGPRRMLTYCPHVEVTSEVLSWGRGATFGVWPNALPAGIAALPPVNCAPEHAALARDILDAMRARVEERDAEGCHNVYADLWQAAGIGFGASPDPCVRERGVQILPGLHDDRAAFLNMLPVLKAAYAALEVAAVEHAAGRGIEAAIPEDSSVLEGLFSDFDAGEPEPLADRGALLGVIDHAKALLP